MLDVTKLLHCSLNVRLFLSDVLKPCLCLLVSANVDAAVLCQKLNGFSVINDNAVSLLQELKTFLENDVACAQSRFCCLHALLSFVSAFRCVCRVFVLHACVCVESRVVRISETFLSGAFVGEQKEASFVAL